MSLMSFVSFVSLMSLMSFVSLMSWALLSVTCSAFCVHRRLGSQKQLHLPPFPESNLSLLRFSLIMLYYLHIFGDVCDALL